MGGNRQDSLHRVAHSHVELDRSVTRSRPNLDGGRVLVARLVGYSHREGNGVFVIGCSKVGSTTFEDVQTLRSAELRLEPAMLRTGPEVGRQTSRVSTGLFTYRLASRVVGRRFAIWDPARFGATKIGRLTVVAGP